MRSLAIAVVVAGACAGTALGVVNISIVAPVDTIGVGQTATVEIWGQGTTRGLWSLAGSVAATGPDDVLSSIADSFEWTAPFIDPRLGIPPGLPPALSAPNGGLAGLVGSQPTPANQTLGRDAPVKVASYTVTGWAPGTVSLVFSPSEVDGCYTSGGPLPADRQIGELAAATVTVVPEPVTLALLALGGLVAARRRVR